MLLATVHDVGPKQPQMVHLQEKKVILVECEDGVWHLDTGASNHITGMRSVLTGLDMSAHSTLHFGDGSSVNIEGLG